MRKSWLESGKPTRGRLVTTALRSVRHGGFFLMLEKLQGIVNPLRHWCRSNLGSSPDEPSGTLPLIPQGTEALQSCFCLSGLHSMRTARRRSLRSTSRRRGAVAAAAPPARRGYPCPREEKSGEKSRGVDITPMSLRQSLFSVAPATPAGRTSRTQARRHRHGPPRPARLWPARRLTLPQPAFLTAWRGRAKQAKHGLYARSVRRGCERVAPPETAARTAGARRQVTAPLSTIVRHCSGKKYCPAASFLASSVVLGRPHDERRSMRKPIRHR